MRDIVRRSFVAFSGPLEGVVPWMYADVRGLVTCAIGILIDPMSYALALPWVRRDGSPATPGEIVQDWHRIKGDASMARLGHRAAERVTALRLTTEGVERVVLAKLDEVDAQLAQRWQEYPTWCADAQLAVLSMAWAMGVGFAYPKFDDAVRRQLWAVFNAEGELVGGAAHECGIRSEDDPRTAADESNPGVRPRNLRNRLLLVAAHLVARDDLDPDRLWGWPAPDAPTLPELPGETDGGDSRRDATTDAVVQAATDGVTERAGD